MIESSITWFLEACVPGLIVGVAMALFNRRQQKRDEEQDRRATALEERRAQQEQDRQKSELLRISMLIATAKLSYAVAMAVKRGKPNGEIEEGIDAYNESLEKFREFEREKLVQNT